MSMHITTFSLPVPSSKSFLFFFFLWSLRNFFGTIPITSNCHERLAFVQLHLCVYGLQTNKFFFFST